MRGRSEALRPPTPTHRTSNQPLGLCRERIALGRVVRLIHGQKAPETGGSKKLLNKGGPTCALDLSYTRSTVLTGIRWPKETLDIASATGFASGACRCADS